MGQNNAQPPGATPNTRSSTNNYAGNDPSPKHYGPDRDRWGGNEPTGEDYSQGALQEGTTPGRNYRDNSNLPGYGR